MDLARCGFVDLKHAFIKVFEPEDQTADPDPVPAPGEAKIEQPEVATEKETDEERSPAQVFYDVECWTESINKYLETLIDKSGNEMTISEAQEDFWNIYKLNLLAKKDLKEFQERTSEHWVYLD